MSLSNATLRKILKDALADQEDAVTHLLAANSPITNPVSKKLLKDALADQEDVVTTKLAVGIGNTLIPAVMAVAAYATLATTAPITLTKALAGAAGNGKTFQLLIAAAAANPTDTVLADFTGTSSAIVLTITPNDGTNNTATPVSISTAQVVELINTGAVVGKNITLTDGSSLRALQTASGGGATLVAHGGEGDNKLGTFNGGVNSASAVLSSLSSSDQVFLKNALADQEGELTAALAAGTNFSS